MRRGANDPSTAPMEIEALQQHGDKKCHTCERFGHLAKDCWQNKNKSKGKDSKGKGGKKGKGKGKGKNDKDVCLKCRPRGRLAKNCPKPCEGHPRTRRAERCKHLLVGGTMAKSGRHRRSRAQLSVSGLRRLSRSRARRSDGWTVAGEPDICGRKRAEVCDVRRVLQQRS